MMVEGRKWKVRVVRIRQKVEVEGGQQPTKVENIRFYYLGKWSANFTR